MNSLIKDFMKRNKVLVSYVRDVYGFRKGVVVALSATELGYSLVNKSADVGYEEMKVWQLPAVQRMAAATCKLEDGTKVPVYSAENILQSKVLRKVAEDDNYVRVPMFNRKVGLHFAIDSAFDGEIKVVDGKITTAMSIVGFDNTTGKHIMESSIPKDKDLWDVIRIVAERASRAKW
jgi:hypothetical protein